MLVISITMLSAAATAYALEKRQAQSSVICSPDYMWMSNSQDLSPCVVTSILMTACSGSDWTVPTINESTHYSRPGEDNFSVNLCSCSWAVYNLASACTLCQGFGQSILSWPFYVSQCDNDTTHTYFPSQLVVPKSTMLPWYAAADPTTWTNQRFNLQDARTLASTGHADINLDVMDVTVEKKPAPIAAIVGGIVGGVGILALLGLAVLLFRMRQAPIIGHMRHPSQDTLTSGFSLPPRRRLTVVSQTTVEDMRFENIVVPFVETPGPHVTRQQPCSGGRASIPIYKLANPSLASISQSAHGQGPSGSRQSDPPEYSPYALAEGGSHF